MDRYLAISCGWRLFIDRYLIVCNYPITSYWLIDIFYLLLTHVFIAVAQLIADSIIYRSGHTNAAWICKAFQTCCDIHPTTKDIIVINDNFSQVDANPKYQPAV